MADKRYIDANEFDFRLPSYLDSDEEILIPLSAVRQAIAMMPAADVVEVRHGHWIIKTDEYDNEYMMCSCCKDEFYPVDAYTVDSTPNYCQTCGAKMDGERKDIP